MSIRDIIEAATPGPWRAGFFGSDSPYVDITDSSDNPLSFLDYNRGGIVRVSADARFIATFDPEHVALMEAVCEAAEDDYMAEPHDDHERNRLATLNAVAALRAYRKERGL